MNTAPQSLGSAEDKNRDAASRIAPLKIDAYLFFDGRCEEAIEFYRRTLGAEVAMLMRFKDSPPQHGCAPVNGEKVMHATLRIGDSVLLVSDGQSEGKTNFQGFALSLNVPNESEANRRFTALADGGRIVQPLSSTFFAKSFGMVTDRFGVMWMVIAMA